MSRELVGVTRHRFHLRRLTAFALVLSAATGVAWVTLTAVAWSVAYNAGVFSSLQEVISQLGGHSTFDVYSLLGFRPVLEVATAVALAGLVWIPALAALLGLAYNACARLLGTPVETVHIPGPDGHK